MPERYPYHFIKVGQVNTRFVIPAGFMVISVAN